MQMKMVEVGKNFKKKVLKRILQAENDFISDLLRKSGVPDSIEDESLSDVLIFPKGGSNKKANSTIIPPTLKDFKKAARAESSFELENRLELVKNKIKSKKSKMSERSKERKALKRLEKERRTMSGRNLAAPGAHKAAKNENAKQEKKVKTEVSPDDGGKDDKRNFKSSKFPIFNEDGKIVFSKFDFSSHPGGKPSKKSRKSGIVNNPREALKTIKKQKKDLNELIEHGDKDKALEFKQEFAWKKAFDKTEGLKVKDDVNLLHKAIKSKKDKKKKSKAKWQERKKSVEQGIEQRQKKRQENINKKIKEKKMQKLKRASKKGRVIPGF